MGEKQVKTKKTYKSGMTDNSAWGGFVLRPDDIVITTPPKCGTTWMQSLALCLIFDRPGMDDKVDDISLWLDPGFRDQSAVARILDEQSHRRCIKTHTPIRRKGYLMSDVRHRTCPLVAPLCRDGEGRARRLYPNFQTSTFSAISSASSTSMPR
jgi:hypothetical protein